MYRLFSCVFILCWLAGSTALAAELPGADNQPYESLAVQFSSSAEGMERQAPHLWTFGNGHTSTEVDPVHTYDYPGRYRVTLSIDGGPPIALVADPGRQITWQDFESWPDGAWNSDPLEPTPRGSIAGGYGYWHDLTDPETTCTSPVGIPIEQGGGGGDVNPDPFRTWVLCLSLGLDEAPTQPWTYFQVLSIEDANAAASIFGVTLQHRNGGYEIQAFAHNDTSLGPSSMDLAHLTPWRPVAADEVRIELHGWIKGPAALDGGGLRLRVLDTSTHEQLIYEELSNIDNKLLSMDSFQYGVVGSQVAPQGGIRLDDYKVLSATCLPPSSSALLGHWDFDDVSNLGLDTSGQGREGTPMGGVTSVVGRPRTPLISELALQLDGTGVVKIPNLGEDLVGLEEVTVEAWIKVPYQDQKNVFRSRQPLGLYSDKVVVSNYIAGNGWEILASNVAPPVDTWYHLAGVFDRGDLDIYLDGVHAGHRNLGFTEIQGTSYGTWAIGGRAPGAGVDADQLLVGAVDDVKVYGRALSEAEIRAAAGLCDP